jgi:hypothetical protein
MSVEPFNIIGLMVPQTVDAGNVGIEEFQAGGLTFERPEPRYIVLVFHGQLIGLKIPPGKSACSKVLLSTEHAALMAAMLIGHAETYVSKTTFTAMLDQQLARVRAELTRHLDGRD